MTWTERFAKDQCETDPNFKAVFEAENALMALIRARHSANLTQQNVADALHVSQSHIAQIEGGTRTPGYLLLFRYASVVGAHIEVRETEQRKTG